MVEKLSTQQGAEDIISRVRAAREAAKAAVANENSPDVPLPIPSTTAEADPAAGAAKPKPKFFADVNTERSKDGSGGKPEKGPGILKRGLKYTVDQLNPIKAFKEIREKWRESGAQSNEELFEEKQIMMFFQDIPWAEKEKYGYSQLRESARIIDQARGELFEKKNEKREQFAGIFSALGIKRDVVDDEDVKRLEANSGDQHKILLEMGMKAFADDPQKLEKFWNQFHQKDVAFREENLEAYFRAQNGKCGDRIVYGLDRIGRTFKDIGFLRKVAITSIGTGGVVIGGAVLGFGALGVSTMMLGSRIGISALGGLALGIGKKLKYEGKRREQEDMEKAEHIEMMLQTTAANLDWGIQKMHESISVGDVKARRAEKILWDTRKAALWGVISAVLGRTAGEYLAYEEITFKSIIEKIGDYTGLSQAFKSIGQSVGHFLSGDQELVKSLGGGGAATQAVEHLQPSGGGMPQDLSEEDYARIKETMASYGPGSNMDEIIAGEAEKMYADGVMPEPEVKAGVIPENLQTAIPETEVKMSDMRAPDAEPQVAEPSSKLLGYHEVKQGGGIERSAKAIIKANPREFGLDPDDPKLNTRAGQKAHVLARGLAEKYGMSYEDLNKIASGHVQKGDQIRIFQDPISGKMNLTYNGAAFDNVLSPDNAPDVSPGGASAAAQEVAPSKGSIQADDVKARAVIAPPDEDAARPRGGAVPEQAEHEGGVAEQPTRARGGEANAAQEVVPRQKIAQDYQSNLDQANQELAARHPEEFAANANETARINIRIHNNERGGWENIFQRAGFSKHGNVWNRSALDIFNQLKQYIPHDVTSADSTSKLNENMVRLGALFKAFGMPPAGMSMDEYLRNIDSNSANLPILNTLKSSPYEELIKPLRR